MSALYRLLSIALILVQVACTLFIVLTLLGIVKGFIDHREMYKYLSMVLEYEHHLNNFVRSIIPTTIGGKDVSRILTLVFFFVLGDMARNLREKVFLSLQRKTMAKKLMRMQTGFRNNNMNSSGDQKISTLNRKIESKIENLRTSKSKTREELLNDFVSIKRELEKTGRDLAFLAIDVVGSTEMKKGEETANVQHDFFQYHNYVEAKLKEHGYIKATWTPDGVMVCFNNINDAVQAAQSIIKGLDYFNKNIKTMQGDFKVRCGINSGFIYYDDNVPLEKHSDRTIDIAGHMQKYASPNTIFIAKQVIKPVKNNLEFIPTERVVDGLEVCEWALQKQIK